MKKFLRSVAVVGVSAVVMAGAAHAGRLSDAFDDMTSVNGTGFYESQIRSGYDIGSGRVSYPRKTLSRQRLIEVTPPLVSAGCSGISYHLGGFSFINFDEIIDLLENALMATPYVALELAIAALSDLLAQALGGALDALQQATAMSLDSCQAARAMVGYGLDALGRKGDICQANEGSKSTMESFMRARSTACSNLQDSQDAVQADIDSMKCVFQRGGDGCPETVDAGESSIPEIFSCVGNCTWTSLMRMGIVQIPPEGVPTSPAALTRIAQSTALGEIIMSTIGARFTGELTDSTDIDPEEAKAYFSGSLVKETLGGKDYRLSTATLDGSTVLSLSICGTNVVDAIKGVAKEEIPDKLQALFASTGVSGDVDRGVLKSIEKLCSPFIIETNESDEQQGEGKVLTCYRPASGTDITDQYKAEVLPTALEVVNADWINQKRACDFVVPVKINDYLAQGYVKEAFDEGIAFNVYKNMLLIQDKLKTGQPLTAENVEFIQAAPFPLYRLLNLSTLFPSMGNSLVTNVGKAMAHMMALEYLNTFVRSASGSSNNGARTDAAVLEKSMENIYSLFELEAKKLVIIDAAMERSMLITKQIGQIEAALLEQVYSRGLMGNYRFAQDIAAAAPPTP